MAKSKLKKTIIVILSTIFIVAIAVILFISPITKYLVEKYDEKYTGRQIKMDHAYVNLFTGYVQFSNLKIYESKSDSVFFSTNGLSFNFSIIKLLFKTYEINQLTLEHPVGIIIQNNRKLSIDDLIERLRPEKSDSVVKPVHFNILNVKINNGEFYYRENVIPINYSIKQINIESSGKRWDSDTIKTKFSFFSGQGSGDIKGHCTLNLNTLDYRLDAVANKFDLQIIEQYLKNLANYGRFTANLDANVIATGNFKDEEDINAHGVITINDFHLGINPNEDYASFSKLNVSMEEVNPKGHKYFFDSIAIHNPFFKYELYDHLDNLETMFGTKGAKIKAANANPNTFNLIIEIAKYMKVLAKNFLKSGYKINRLAVHNGDFIFNDYSYDEKFSVAANPLSIIADSINKNHQQVIAILNSGIHPYGNVFVKLNINPKDSADFDIKYHLKKIPVAMFNPYIISYSSFPLDRGTLELNGVCNVKRGIIKSNNHLLIIDPRTSKRVRNKDRKWLPMPLIMSFIRERGNVIDYEIPITGNLNNPKFHFRDVIFHLLENIFIKPPTFPYGMEVKKVENEIEKSLMLKWELRQNTLQPNEEKFVTILADFLKEYPQASISIHSNTFEEKEKEYILFYEAKKKYFLSKNNIKISSFSKDDSLKIDKMSVKDPLFLTYLKGHIKDTLLFTIQQKCLRFIDNNIVNTKYNQLLKQRENYFRLYFKKNGTDNRVKFYAEDKKIPYNGFPFYKIDYKGELPEALSKAYQQMNELNIEAPRDKYLKQRKTISVESK